jgi:hypothetical protein
MDCHDRVLRFAEISDDENYVFRVIRTPGLPDVKVHLSDAYNYGEMDYLQRPAILNRGDFVLIAKPEGNYFSEDVERARRDGIGLGKIGKFMGALNCKQVWLYKTPEEKHERRGRGTG